MSFTRTFDEIGPGDIGLVGGKGLSLALLTRAGLPVPLGFCVTSDAPHALRGQTLSDNAPVATAIDTAYQRLGAGPVAVRSSATAEDGAVSSFAGQQETFLGVTGAADVRDAVARCWASLDSARAIAYRKQRQIGDNGLAMAVVVQRLVAAEAAGVLFTRDPLDATGTRMLVEAAWGLGEGVVSGRVAPDRFHLDRASGRVVEQHISIKTTRVTPTGLQAVPAELQARACLGETQLTELADLGRRVEAYYGDARDVEWAWADGRCWLLQARPITAAGAAEREQVRREEIAALAAKAEPAGTVWARFNLAEILPEPTPMAWAIVRRFLSGQGGFGLMYRDLGFDLDPALNQEGIYDLVCGRPYCNLSREPRMQFRSLPFEHSFTALKATPQKAMYPQPVFNPANAGWRFWLFLPWFFVKLTRSAVRLRRLGKTFGHSFLADILPAFEQQTAEWEIQDLRALSPGELLDELERRTRATLCDFARDSLKPTVLAAVAMGNLERALTRTLGPERTRAALGELIMGVRPTPTADVPFALHELAQGRLTRTEFVRRFGHRGSQEMELARPRWVEDEASLDRLLALPPASGGRKPPGFAPDTQTKPGGLRPPLASGTSDWERVAAEAKLTPAQQTALHAELEQLHTYLSLRETGKHFLMKGYAQIRRVLVELDQRFRLNGDIFYLTPEELPQLTAGDDLSGSIAQRRRRRAVALSLDVPPVLFSDDLDAVGRPAAVDGAATLQGVPLSAGVAEGPALVLKEPVTAEPPTEGYILVCPTTDPAWVPLFVNARGLVMETGGVLSHGAIVAREFGLPAVAGLPGVLRRVQSGQRLRVDGATGQVTVLSSSSASNV